MMASRQPFLVYVLGNTVDGVPSIFRLVVNPRVPELLPEHARAKFQTQQPGAELHPLQWAYLNGERLDVTDSLDLETLRVYSSSEDLAGRPPVCIMFREEGGDWPDLSSVVVKQKGVTAELCPLSTNAILQEKYHDLHKLDTFKHYGSDGQWGGSDAVSHGPELGSLYSAEEKLDTKHLEAPTRLTLWQRHKRFIMPPTELLRIGEPSEYWPWILSTHRISIGLEYVSLIMTLISVVVFCLETLPRYRLDSAGNDKTYEPFVITEAVCIAWFTWEYLWRLFFAANKEAYVKNGLNIVDLIAIVPYYITLIIENGSSSGSFAVVRILRISRVSRLARVSRHSLSLQDVAECMWSTSNELALFFVMTSVATILFGAAIYFCEKDEDGTKFISIPAGFWWAIVTMSTVGYGDIYPVTIQGKIVGAITATVGVILLAIPAGIFISEFLKLHEFRKQTRAQKHSHEEPLVQLQRQLAAAQGLVGLLKIEHEERLKDEEERAVHRKTHRESLMFGIGSDGKVNVMSSDEHSDTSHVPLQTIADHAIEEEEEKGAGTSTVMQEVSMDPADFKVTAI